MFRPVPMSQISLIVLRRDLDRLALEMVHLGAVHLHRVEEIDPWTATLDALSVEQRLTAVEARLNEVDTLLVKLELRPTLASLPTEPPKTDLDALGQKLQTIGEQVDEALAARRTTADEIRRIGSLLELPVSEAAVPAIDPATRFAFMETFMGTMSRAHVEVVRSELTHVPSVIIPFKVADGSDAVLIMVLKKDRSLLAEALSKVRAAPLEKAAVAPSQEMRARLTQRIEELKRQEAEARRQLDALRTRHTDTLRDARAALEIERAILGAQQTLRGTTSTALVSAWVSRRKARSIAERLIELVGGRCYIEIRTPEEIDGVADGLVQVPVELSNPGFLKPFEMLVKGYDTPAYDGIDPTPIVGLTFLLMFGLMFGDMGQGAVVALIGLLVARRTTMSSGMRRIGSLLVFCGISAIGFGIYYGELFGKSVNEIFGEGTFPWAFKPFENSGRFLASTIYIGITIISVGLVLNIIMQVRRRKLFEAIFSRTGLIGGVIYWGAVAIVIKSMVFGHTIAQMQWWIIGFIIVPLVLFAFRGAFSKLLHPREKAMHEGCGMYVIETAIESFEIFTGFLANTVSFVRIAAYGLSHAGIFFAVFTITKMLSGLPGALGTTLQAIIIIVGNAVVIALEGMVAGIQALRLEYYEFFSKFFAGGGKEFKPLRAAGTTPGMRSRAGVRKVE
jgi:V/A-type H+-transporting ATPase subunit I